MTDYATLIPVSVVTGFLGSGKTTLLKDLLASPRLRETAVLINEFGEIGLDHHLLQHVAESTLLLDNGCLCCAVRSDLTEALRDLLSRRERGEIPYFRRVVVETSGLADPVPIAYTILADPILQNHFRLGRIVTTVDAVNGMATLAGHPESIKQVAVADRLILTKTELCESETVEPLIAKLRRLNGSAPIVRAEAGGLGPEMLVGEDMLGAETGIREAAKWLAADDANLSDLDTHDHRHAEGGIYSFCLTFDGPLDWAAFGIWMSMLLHRHGENVLRLKGLLNVAGAAAPVLINGVQHIVHPPAHLDAWPDGDRRSRIIFILRDLKREEIEASLAIFNRLAHAPPAASHRDRALGMV